MKHLKKFPNKYLSKLQVLLVICLLAFSTSCENKIQDLPFQDSNILQSDKAEDVTFIFSKEGQTKAVLKGKHFTQNEQAKPPFVDLEENLIIDFYDDSLQVESTLTANFGRYYPNDGNIIVRDSVVVLNKKQEQLETEELIWNQKIERFYTDKFVKITMDGEVSYGEGLEANQDFSWFKIIRQTGSIPVDKSDLPFE